MGRARPRTGGLCCGLLKKLNIIGTHLNISDMCMQGALRILIENTHLMPVLCAAQINRFLEITLTKFHSYVVVANVIIAMLFL